MKSKSLFLGAFVFFGTVCSAQSKFSIGGEGSVLFLPKVEGGDSYANVVSAEKGTGIGYNLFLNYSLNKNLSFSLGLQYRYLNFYFANEGWGYPNWIFENKMECKNLGIPLLINIILPINEPISCFLTSGLVLGAYNTLAITTYQGHSAMNPDLASARGGNIALSTPLNLGFSWKFNTRFALIFRGGFEFLYQGIHLNYEDYISGRTIKNLNLGATYRFGKKG